MTEITQIDRSLITAGNNDRTKFDTTKLAELAASIKEHGLLQAVTVRRLPECDLYQIIAGERRFRAISLLGWETVPCIVADVSEGEASALMLAENTAREDLDPIDEAAAYAARIERLGWSVEDCARHAGVSTIRVQFRTKLLKLRPDIQALVRSGNFPIGYAQILADAGLDRNFQGIAIKTYNEASKPTTGWFRRLVNDLLTQQAQGALFDLPLLGGPIFEAAPIQADIEPPHPSTTIPPKSGKTAREVLTRQVLFWQEAAAAWDKLGKPFKRQECEAAALALQSALQFI